MNVIDEFLIDRQTVKLEREREDKKLILKSFVMLLISYIAFRYEFEYV